MPAKEFKNVTLVVTIKMNTALQVDNDFCLDVGRIVNGYPPIFNKELNAACFLGTRVEVKEA